MVKSKKRIKSIEKGIVKNPECYTFKFLDEYNSFCDKNLEENQKMVKGKKK